MNKNYRTVVVLGASDKRERYSNRAVRLLKSEGYRPVPVHPTLTDIQGIPVRHGLGDITEKVDTLTVYLSPEKCLPFIGDIVAMKPGRVILNPGTESSELEARLTHAGIPILKACTLVMLSTGQF
jgi:predicted CoA-binding protein